ncbi:MAG: DAK2 domain-containing protein [Bryobacterales bacterium]|nr:DAK2 domain-containing protein [Bryobacterales bacterium]MDE0622545.1 DAK2 domain-containing protein [Bryobacterales bacterium]
MGRVSGEAVAAAVRRASREVMDQEEQLTALDQAMGDGDLGITLTKIGTALDEFARSTPVDDDIGKWLGKAGMTANRAGSSSFGTLLATALMRGGRTVMGKSGLTPEDLATLFEAADIGVQERGKAKLGDKTVVDALHPAREAFATAVAQGEPISAAGQAAVAAAERGRDSVTPLRSKIGRASWVGERSEGKVDAGCEALVVILRALLA